MKSNNWRPVPWSLAMHANLFGLFIMGGLIWLMNGCPPSPPRQPPPRPVYPSTELIWSYETGGGVETTPALAGGLLYFGSSDHHVYALDAASGELVWRYQTGGPVFSSPAVAAGIVYVGSDDHRLYALDAASGEPLWKYETGVLRQRYSPGPQVRSTPVVAEGMVYFDSGDGNTYALDAATGELRWHAAPGDVASSPEAMNGVVFVGAGDEHLYALDAATGETLWRYATNGHVSGRPTVQENVVYVSAVDWSSRDHFLRVYALQADTGEQLWSTRIVEGFGEVDYSPVPAGSVVYVSTYSGLYTLDTATGEILHTYQGYHLRSAPIVDEGVIYVGDLYALNAADGNIIWHYDLESGENSLAARTGFSVHPTPAKGGGVVYVGSLDGHLYALDASMRIPAQAAKQAPAEDPPAPPPPASSEKGGVFAAYLWRYAIGIPGTGPTVIDGKVYAGSGDGFLYILDVATGDLDRRFHTNSRLGSAPVVVEDTVFFATIDGYLHALEPASQTLLWRYKTGDENGSPPRRRRRRDLCRLSRRPSLCAGRRRRRAALALQNGR